MGQRESLRHRAKSEGTTRNAKSLRNAKGEEGSPPSPFAFTSRFAVSLRSSRWPVTVALRGPVQAAVEVRVADLLVIRNRQVHVRTVGNATVVAAAGTGED